MRVKLTPPRPAFPRSLGALGALHRALFARWGCRANQRGDRGEGGGGRFMRIDGTAFTHREVGTLGSNGFGGMKGCRR